MKIYVVDDYRQMSLKAASIVASQVILKPNSVLGLATGSTPEGMYRELVQMHKQGIVDFTEVVTFNLDEYLGLPTGHPQSYHYYMYNHLFNHINIAPGNIHIPAGKEKDIEEFCRQYDRMISEAGGIDLQVLGIGVNGHIGFNEPGSHLNLQTHVVDLAEETIQANSRFFDSPDQVPRRAITMGIGSIMQAGRIILLASGQSKARAIKETVSGKVTTGVPASVLQLHNQVSLVLDREAASLL